MPRLQELIHALEVGSGARYLRVVALLLAVVTIAVIYDLRELQNFKTEEAMDAAQVGRNVAEGRGFTTRYIRPFSMALVRDHRADRDPLIKGEHPDLANPPLYPLVLAGLMKIPGLFEYQIPSPKEGQFRRHQPDFLITLFNQGLLFLAIALTWYLARKLFEPKVGLLTALAMLGSEVLWQFSGSGLPTMLALVLFMLLINLLYALSVGSRRDPVQALGVAVILAAACGLLCGALCLTRYALGVLIIPVVIYLISGFPGRRVVLPVVAGVLFLATISPWLVRNYQVCGNPFGLAPYSLAQETSQFTENWLVRSLDTDVSKVGRDDLVRKTFLGASQVLREELPQLGGSWLTAFFLAGLLVPFVDRSRAHLRWFTVGALAALSLAQILSRTYLSTDMQRFNSENLLVLMTPMVAMFGMALVWLLVYSLEVFAEAWRSVVLGLVITVLWIPLIVAFGPPRTFPIAYPPYYPPTIQRVSQWFEPGELVMTDMPWAVAWYGDRQAVLMSKSPDQEFLDINDWQKPVNGLYLTRLSLDQRFLSGWVLNARQWGRFIIDILTKGEVPKGFPLRKSPAFMHTFPDHLLMADRERWTGSSPISVPKALTEKDSGTANNPSTAPDPTGPGEKVKEVK